MPRSLRREDYTVGWVCALPIELAAAKAMLDEEHDRKLYDFDGDDGNVYSYGSVAGHNVVIACLPGGRIGTESAATVATQMRATFKRIHFGLAVGIGGGVPNSNDIRLGDVAVSQPSADFGGVVQWDMGKDTEHGFLRTGSLDGPPQILLNAIHDIKCDEMLEESELSDHISLLERRYPIFQRSKAGPDILFDASYPHKGEDHDCKHCSADQRQKRPQREQGKEVKVHYGTIASGNRVIESAKRRDEISKQIGSVLCFEMIAAGLMNVLPCLVIRGVCNYADSHKNKKWQAYAAGVAAAYAKVLLLSIPARNVMREDKIQEAMSKREHARLSVSPDNTPAKHRRVNSSNDLENRSPSFTLPLHHLNSTEQILDDEQQHNYLASLHFE